MLGQRKIGCEVDVKFPILEGRFVKRVSAVGLSVFLPLLTACSGASNGSGSTNPALNLAGTWTVTATSTQGHGSSSAVATVSQSGQGLGVAGATTLSAPVGQVAVTQTGTTLAGSITNLMKVSTLNFAGTLSSGNLTATGSANCPALNSKQVTTSITATLTSSSAQGTYTVTRGSGCYGTSDAGTFTATKK